MAQAVAGYCNLLYEEYRIISGGCSHSLFGYLSQYLVTTVI
jgi:hypothetical protein